MSNILLITSSPRGEQSVSSRFALELAETLKARAAGGAITRHDLGAEPIPHLDPVSVTAFRTPADQRTPQQQAAADYSDRLVAELLAADTVILATGLINFNISSSLKSWIDNIARAGQTFKYDATGPVGLVTGKKVYIVLASDGVYSASPAAAMNHAVPYLKAVLGFMGMSDVEVLHIEGLAYGPQAVENAIAAAKAKVVEFARAAA